MEWQMKGVAEAEKPDGGYRGAALPVSVSFDVYQPRLSGDVLQSGRSNRAV